MLQPETFLHSVIHQSASYCDKLEYVFFMSIYKINMNV